jgi:hypothetical protein
MPTINVKFPNGAEHFVSWDMEAKPGSDEWKVFGLAQQTWLAFFGHQEALALLVVHYFSAPKLFEQERSKLAKMRDAIYEQMKTQDKTKDQVWTEHLTVDLYLALREIGDIAIATLKVEELHAAILKVTRKKVELDLAITPLRGSEYKNINMEDAEELKLMPGDFAMEQAIEMKQAIEEAGIREDILKALEEERPQTPAQRQWLSRWKKSRGV